MEFVAADMPFANKLTIHILAAVAEHEREAISERTNAALGSHAPTDKDTIPPARNSREHTRRIPLTALLQAPRSATLPPSSAAPATSR